MINILFHIMNTRENIKYEIKFKPNCITYFKGKDVNF